MRQPTIIFEPEARYAFVTDKRDVGVLIAQRVNIRLGDVAYQHGDTECMAVVCRVQVRLIPFLLYHTKVYEYLSCRTLGS